MNVYNKSLNVIWHILYNICCMTSNLRLNNFYVIMYMLCSKLLCYIAQPNLALGGWFMLISKSLDRSVPQALPEGLASKERALRLTIQSTANWANKVIPFPLCPLLRSLAAHLNALGSGTRTSDSSKEATPWTSSWHFVLTVLVLFTVAFFCST